MVRKVLFTATLVRGHIAKFHIPYLRWFKKQGWETWVASKYDYPEANRTIPYCDHFVDIGFDRSPFSAQTLKAYKELRLLFEEERFDLVHTHTPVASVLTRLAYRGARNDGGKIIYTAHGFHFYDGAPLRNWMLWFPVEKIMSRYTDLLLTINQQDYQRACSFSACTVGYVHGVGVDVPPCVKLSGEKGDNSIIEVLAVGDLNKNKNHEVLIKAISMLPERYRLKIAGDGPYYDHLCSLVCSLGLSERVSLLGFRDDIPELLSACDVFALSSYREGLPLSLLEAMAASVPCVSSSCRGATELLGDCPDMIVDGDSPQSFAVALKKLGDNWDLRRAYGKVLYEKAKIYSLENTLSEHAQYYERTVGGLL